MHPRLAFLLVIALLLAACGGAAAPATPDPGDTPAPTATAAVDPTPDGNDGAAPSPGTTLNACEIVTPADVAAATDATDVAEGALEARPTTLSPGRTQCTYTGDWGRLIVELTPEDGVNLYDAARRSYKDAVDITGIGDGAFNSIENKRAFVVKGSVAVMLTMFPSATDRLELAEALVKAVVAKL
jgi:hypothetical protein